MRTKSARTWRPNYIATCGHCLMTTTFNCILCPSECCACHPSVNKQRLIDPWPEEIYRSCFVAFFEQEPNCMSRWFSSSSVRATIENVYAGNEEEESERSLWSSTLRLGLVPTTTTTKMSVILVRCVAVLAGICPESVSSKGGQDGQGVAECPWRANHFRWNVRPTIWFWYDWTECECSPKFVIPLQLGWSVGDDDDWAGEADGWGLFDWHPI